jgi:hypothetical protein
VGSNLTKIRTGWATKAKTRTLVLAWGTPDDGRSLIIRLRKTSLALATMIAAVAGASVDNASAEFGPSSDEQRNQSVRAQALQVPESEVTRDGRQIRGPSANRNGFSPMRAAGTPRHTRHRRNARARWHGWRSHERRHGPALTPPKENRS